MPMLIRCRTLTSFVNNLAPYCNPTPSMIASINPKTSPNCSPNALLSFQTNDIMCFFFGLRYHMLFMHLNLLKFN